MHVLVTGKKEESPWSDLAEFKLVQDVMDGLVTCKYEEDPIKNEGARVFTTFSPL